MSIHQVTATVADLLTIAPDQNRAPEARESAEVRALVDAARAGSRDAFGDLVLLHERVVLRTALAALSCRADAEDVAQEAFVVAWQRLGGFRGEASFRTWLLTITWRKALDRRRSRRRWWQAPSKPDETFGDEISRAVSVGPDPEAQALARDLARRTATAIAALSPKLRDTLLLAASGEHSYESIGNLLGIPLGTVKWRVAEARRLVSASLQSNGGTS
jgi:RNA polymerase sigma-70 factor (ECF subfamily)